MSDVAKYTGKWAPSSAQARRVADVARAFNLSAADLHHRSRFRHIVRARRAAAWVMRQCYPALRYPQLGVAVGYRDHSDVSKALRRAEELRGQDSEFRAITDRLVADVPLPVRPAPLKPFPAWEKSPAPEPEHEYKDQADFVGMMVQGSERLLAAVARQYPHRVKRAAVKQPYRAPTRSGTTMAAA